MKLYNYENQRTFDITSRPYEYDKVMVIEHEGDYYLGTDSGCSCPTPFENYSGLEDMTGPLTLEQAVEELTSLVTTREDKLKSIEAEGETWELSYIEDYPEKRDFEAFLAEVRGM